MLRLAGFPAAEVGRSLADGRFRLKVGRFQLAISSAIPELQAGLEQVYGHYPVSIAGGHYDYDIKIQPASWWRRWFRRNALFSLSGQAPFLPMAAEHAHAMFEWGLNWTIGSSAHQYLILHSAVIERDGKAVMLPALSGSGKSTLAAELVMRGWRLFSDELALIDGPELSLVPFPRPVSLKNQSIELIRTRHPQACFGPLARDTLKGNIAHMRVPEAAVERAEEASPPSLIVFPKWTAGASLRVDPVAQGQTALRLIEQSFNYSLLGRLGFERLAELVTTAPAWEIEYSRLDDAVATLDDLLSENG